MLSVSVSRGHQRRRVIVRRRNNVKFWGPVGRLTCGYGLMWPHRHSLCRCFFVHKGALSPGLGGSAARFADRPLVPASRYPRVLASQPSCVAASLLFSVQVAGYKSLHVLVSHWTFKLHDSEPLF